MSQAKQGKKPLTYKNTMHACQLGSITQAIINNLAPLLFVIFQDRYHVSLEQIGLLILINFITQLIIDALSVKFADRIGYRPLLIAAHGMCALGLVLLSILPGTMASPYAGLVIAVICYAIGGGLIEVLTSPIADSLPSDSSAATMAFLHSFYCWGHVLVVLGTTLGLLIIGNDAWYVLPILWALVPIYNAFNFSRVPLMPTLSAGGKLPLRGLLSNRLFLLAMLLMICGGAAEQAMAQWASLFAEKGLHVSKTLGDLLGPCLFAVLMGVGRLLFGLFGGKIKLARVLGLTAILTIACYLVTSLVANPLVALIACALSGLGVSLMWPGTLSLSARSFGGGTAMFSLLALGGDLGCSVGPWLTGVVSGAAQKMQSLLTLGEKAGLDPVQIGLKAGLLVAVIFPVGLLIGVVVMQRKASK